MLAAIRHKAMNDQTTPLTWRDTHGGRVPISTRFDDPYYSLDNGLAETHHVFIDGNDLPARANTPLHIAELGFGTGLNFLACLSLRRSAPLRFTSFEQFPLETEQIATALRAFPAIDPTPLLQAYAAALHGPSPVTPQATLHIITGDARNTLPTWHDKADAWFLDGFSPAKNPELWSDTLMQEVAHHTNPGGTLATYTAAGHVRRALATAGFDVMRTAGFGRKRHMTRATLPG
jgi:tRNA U34 5-methylaminomethyl-2-thiouridine-forming methyltransferase MnmC